MLICGSSKIVENWIVIVTTSTADKDEAASAAESQSSEVVYVIPDMDVVEMQIEELTQEAANASPVVTQDATASEEVCVGVSASERVLLHPAI